MAIDSRLFSGIKQVTKSYFSELDDSEKVGYLWFVRMEEPPQQYEIYLGTQKYGETNTYSDIIPISDEELEEMLIPQCIEGNLIDCENE